MTDPQKAVFLSYASQDAAAAARICEALRAAGIEVWFDQSELRGGDAWDRQIARQIRECALLIAVISVHTDERSEDYFGRQWRLAVERTRDLADDPAFLLPVVIDGTPDAAARVPDKFREVQWSRLPGGETTPAFVQRVSHLLSPSHAHAPAQPRPSATPAPTLRQPAPGPVAPPWTQRVLLLIAAVAVIGGGYFALDKFVLSKRSAAGTQAPSSSIQAGTPAHGAITEKSIAVLPFADLSEQKDQEYFSDGLAEGLLDLLAQVPDLHVPARTSSFSFKGKSDDIATIAQKLRVAHVLEGSVRKSGTRLQVTVELIRADNGYHAWSKTYDRDIKDVFTVQDEIATAVVEALKAKLAPTKQASSHRTSNPEAYNQLLLGRQFYDRGNLDDFRRAVEAYRKAIALDPNYAAAYAGLVYAEFYVADQTGDVAGFKRANAAAEKAVALAPDEAAGYAARGFTRATSSWDWAGAQADFAKALALDPADISAQRRYGQLVGSLGRLPDAIAAFRDATELDPLSNPAWRDLGRYLMLSRDFAGAHEALRRALEIQPESSYALNSLGMLQLLEGKAAEALATYGKLDREAFRLSGIAMAEHTLGHAKESRLALDQLIAKHAQEAAYQIAQVYAWRGEKDKGFEWLEQAYQQSDAGLANVKIELLLAGLRDDPRYTALLRELNLPE